MSRDPSTRPGPRPTALPTGERVRHVLLLFGLLAMSLAVGCEFEADAPPDAAYAGRLMAAGNHNNLFVLVTAPVAGIDGFRLWQRDASGLWHTCDPARGRPAALAAWREHLLVFFPSGRWGRFGMDRPVIEPAPLPAWTPAAVCENGLTADAFGYAPGGEAVLLQFADGAWSTRPEIVTGIERDRVLDPQLVHHRDRLMLVWREEVQDFPGSGAPFRIRFLIRRGDGKWQGPLASRLRVASVAHVAAAGDILACLYRKPAAAEEADRWFLATYATADEDWHEAGPLDGLPADGPVALARSGKAFFVATLQGDTPTVAGLDVASRTLEPFTRVAGGADRPEAGQSWVALLMTAAMMLVVLWLIARRGHIQTIPAQQDAGEAGVVPPAPLRARAGAVVADDVVVLVPMALVVSAAVPSLAGTVEQMMAGAEVDVTRLLILEGIRVGAVIVYFTLAEGLFGRTIGKALFRLEVRADGGDRMTFGQGAVRNLFRPVDELPMFYVLGLVLVVHDARGRRLGDRVARTRVVRAPSSPPGKAE